MDILKKKVWINIWFFALLMKKRASKKYNDVFNGIRNKIKKVSGDECDYEKDYMEIKFNSDDDLPWWLDPFLKKMVNFLHKFF